ncbi:alpha/beta hydrolase [Thiomicrorhabdus indica]|uniref:alpha/beta hydrolase n=1 Tax=Thiomicrorhabdus indica TaxID=2267253 RepID=UPI00102D8221|nr:alpha/beta fold hydrolase [Thiomicrorhabdus indica]
MSIGLLSAIVTCVFLMAIMAIHIGFRAPRLANEEPSKGVVFDVVEFEGKQKTLLHGWWLPAGDNFETTVVLLHGWGANKSLLLTLAKAFHNIHCHVLMIDAHNHGDSQSRGVATMPKFSEDLDSAIAWCRSNRPEHSQKVLAVGHSVGAAATLLSASKTSHADAYIAISSFAHPKLMMKRHLGKLSKIPLLTWLLSAYVQKVIGHRFDEIAPVNTIQQISKPVLCLHGNRDSVIPIEDFHLICKSSKNSNVQCAEIADADHDSIDLIEQNFSLIESFLADLDNFKSRGINTV